MMDATTQAFVTEIVSRRIAENWLYWCLFLAASFLASFAGAYIKRRAENLATRDDFDDLKRQLQENTRVTEEIKTEIGHAEWRAREANALKRVKIEELLRDILASHQKASDFFKQCATGTVESFDSTDVDTASVIATLYFPNLRMPVENYAYHIFSMGSIAFDVAAAVSKATRERSPDLEVVRASAREQYADNYQTLARFKRVVEEAARAEMDALLYVER
ncbi:hypothetical protein [Cupriavidus pauculus]|uniref:Uncharacterized protein n=1 Tax=Cupriavidus pauculus TaxID=82633 RepID=A0A3G8H606_9BURK|nr:hypothetical protein [Cupriavidus pauculus]AZG14972.1 hypothetical protein EHF44_16955 [Cupriavidus pauculus]